MREVISLRTAIDNTYSFRLVAALFILLPFSSTFAADVEQPELLFDKYCIDCHEGANAAGSFDLSQKLNDSSVYLETIFENVATEKMPPADVDPPSAKERQEILRWLAARSPSPEPAPFRRLSRHEFVHSVNDLLGTNLNLADQISEDRGTYNFDSDRRIQLSKEILGSYFAVADTMLDAALPS